MFRTMALKQRLMSQVTKVFWTTTLFIPVHTCFRVHTCVSCFELCNVSSRWWRTTVSMHALDSYQLKNGRSRLPYQKKVGTVRLLPGTLRHSSHWKRQFQGMLAQTCLHPDRYEIHLLSGSHLTYLPWTSRRVNTAQTLARKAQVSNGRFDATPPEDA
jgi:hypothetical protein